MIRRRPMFSRGSALATAMLAGGAALPAGADEVRLEDGATIRAVQLASVDARRVAFRDARGRIDGRPLTLVASLVLDAHPLVAQAESLAAAGAGDAAVRTMARALVATAPGDPTAAWMRVRLLRLHAARGEATLARAHLAALLAADPDADWGRLEPAGGDATTIAPGALAIAAREAHAAVRLARAASDEPRVVALLDRLAARLPAGDGAEAPATLSGLPLAALGLAPAPASTPNADAASPGRAPAGTAAPPAPSAVPATALAAPDDGADGAEESSAAALEAVASLLANHRADEAVAACERALRSPPSSGVPALLRAYGEALAAAGRDEEALLAHLRVGLLHPRSRHAAPCLVAASDLYLHIYGDRAAATRLAERAEALARDDDARSAARGIRLRLAQAPGEP